MSEDDFFISKINWQAKWIWAANVSGADTWCCFRRRFTADALKKNYKLYAAVDSKYYLYINGNLVVYEGGLNRGPKPGGGYFDEIDVTHHVKQGINTIAVLVWYWGNEGRNSINSGAGGLLLQLEQENEVKAMLVSDGTWHVRLHPAYSTGQEPLPSYLYGGHNITFNAENDIADWYHSNYDSDSWNLADEIGEVGCLPWGELYKRPVPQIRFGDINLFASYKTEQRNGYKIIIAELPHAMQCAPVMKINSPAAGLDIDIRSDRYEVNGGPGDNTNVYRGHRIDYKIREGIHFFEALNWFFAEQIIFTVPDCVNICEIGYRQSGYDTDIAGCFISDNTFLNKLCDKAALTLYACMRDNYMDCPDRERGQWIGDVSSQLPQAFYVLDRRADLLSKKAIYDFVSFRQNAVLYGNVPGIHFSELPSQSLNAISTKGMIMTCYAYTGEKKLISDTLPAVLDYLNLWVIEEDGRLVSRSGNWKWFDHGKNIDATVLEHIWYCMALDAAIEMCKIADSTEHIDSLQLRKEKVAAFINKKFWQDDGYRSENYLDDRANGLAVLAGLADQEKWPVVLRVLQSVYEATPYMEGYILEALFMMGYGNEALNRMKKRYERMVEHHSTTLWEDFEIFGTMNHAWSGAPLALLSRYVIGIDADYPRYRQYHVFPELLTLCYAKTKVPVNSGVINVEINRTDSQFELQLYSPANTSAIVGVPKTPFYNVKNKQTDKDKIIDNRSLIVVSSDSDNTDEVAFMYENDDYFVYQVPPGNWTFRAGI